MSSLPRNSGTSPPQAQLSNLLVARGATFDFTEMQSECEAGGRKLAYTFFLDNPGQFDGSAFLAWKEVEHEFRYSIRSSVPEGTFPTHVLGAIEEVTLDAFVIRLRDLYSACLTEGRA